MEKSRRGCVGYGAKSQSWPGFWALCGMRCFLGGIWGVLLWVGLVAGASAESRVADCAAGFWSAFFFLCGPKYAQHQSQAKTE